MTYSDIYLYSLSIGLVDKTDTNIDVKVDMTYYTGSKKWEITWVYRE